MKFAGFEIKRVLTEPYWKFGKWWVDIQYSFWGEQTACIMCETKEDTEKVVVGAMYKLGTSIKGGDWVWTSNGRPSGGD